MKAYDFDKAKNLIEQHKEKLLSASLGMHEDWFWTAEPIWENGQYTRELLSNEDAAKLHAEYMEQRKAGMSILSHEATKYNACNVGGINGSDWATPTLQLVFEDGDKMIPCYIGEDAPFEESVSKTGTMQAALLGCLSGPVQERITPLTPNQSA